MSIGYGHSIRPGEEWLKTAVITKAYAAQLLDKDLQNAVDSTNRQLTRAVTQGQADALFDFEYNDGTGARRKGGAYLEYDRRHLESG